MYAAGFCLYRFSSGAEIVTSATSVLRIAQAQVAARFWLHLLRAEHLDHEQVVPAPSTAQPS